MQKRTIVDQITETRDGMLEVRLIKQILEDDGTVLAQQYHRTAIAPGTGESQIAAVDAHLAEMGAAPVESWERVKQLLPVIHHEAAVKAFKARLAQEQPASEPSA